MGLVKIPQELKEALRKEKYQMIGIFAAVKKCHWMHEALVHDRYCYKQKFYGIKSHRCIQMTPTLACTMRCQFCWRIQPGDLGVIWDERSMITWDDPDLILEKSIEAQRRILTGYKSHPLVSEEKFQEAWYPKHVAISLAGEPTLYPLLGQLIQACHRQGMTTFLVTNGTNPKALKELEEEPSQLYISVCASDKETFRELCRPQIPDAWEKLMESLELMLSFNCPKVIRITLVKGYNMKNPEKYAKIIEKANPTYVEPKAYSYLGYSRRRLSKENSPLHSEVKEFAKELAKFIGYNIVDESFPSRVVLLSQMDKPIRYKLQLSRKSAL